MEFWKKFQHITLQKTKEYFLTFKVSDIW
jgi:hypothetical protein